VQDDHCRKEDIDLDELNAFLNEGFKWFIFNKHLIIREQCSKDFELLYLDFIFRTDGVLGY